MSCLAVSSSLILARDIPVNLTVEVDTWPLLELEREKKKAGASVGQGNYEHQFHFHSVPHWRGGASIIDICLTGILLLLVQNAEV